jgi:glycosyltransferase involved in cell wall biosynthesis
MKKLSIIIPAYNESATIHHILKKLLDVELPDGLQHCIFKAKH